MCVLSRINENHKRTALPPELGTHPVLLLPASRVLLWAEMSWLDVFIMSSSCTPWCCGVIAKPCVHTSQWTSFSSSATQAERKGHSHNSLLDRGAKVCICVSQIDLAPLQVFLNSPETLSGVLCKWGNEAFLSPDWLSLEDSQSLLKLCVFLGQPHKSQGWSCHLSFILKESSVLYTWCACPRDRCC